MRACGATRLALRDAGWECAGAGLIVVTWIEGHTLPVVLPRRALEIVEPESWWDLPVQPFAGGDHVHLCVPRRPTSFRGDTPWMFGDAVMSAKYLGGLPGGGQMWMGAQS